MLGHLGVLRNVWGVGPFGCVEEYQGCWAIWVCYQEYQGCWVIWGVLSGVSRVLGDHQGLTALGHGLSYLLLSG